MCRPEDALITSFWSRQRKYRFLTYVGTANVSLLLQAGPYLMRPDSTQHLDKPFAKPLARARAHTPPPPSSTSPSRLSTKRQADPHQRCRARSPAHATVRRIARRSPSCFRASFPVSAGATVGLPLRSRLSYLASTYITSAPPPPVSHPIVITN